MLLFISGAQGQLCIARKLIFKQTRPHRKGNGLGPQWALKDGGGVGGATKVSTQLVPHNPGWGQGSENKNPASPSGCGFAPPPLSGPLPFSSQPQGHKAVTPSCPRPPLIVGDLSPSRKQTLVGSKNCTPHAVMPVVNKIKRNEKK